jgi:hypothetical protein
LTFSSNFGLHISSRGTAHLGTNALLVLTTPKKYSSSIGLICASRVRNAARQRRSPNILQISRHGSSEEMRMAVQPSSTLCRHETAQNRAVRRVLTLIISKLGGQKPCKSTQTREAPNRNSTSLGLSQSVMRQEFQSLMSWSELCHLMRNAVTIHLNS